MLKISEVSFNNDNLQIFHRLTVVSFHLIVLKVILGQSLCSLNSWCILAVKLAVQGAATYIFYNKLYNFICIMCATHQWMDLFEISEIYLCDTQRIWVHIATDTHAHTHTTHQSFGISKCWPYFSYSWWSSLLCELWSANAKHVRCDRGVYVKSSGKTCSSPFRTSIQHKINENNVEKHLVVYGMPIVH